MGAQAENVGAVSIDLLIHNTIGRQIGEMSAQAGAQAERQFNTVGQKAGEAFARSFDRSVATAQRSLKRVEMQHEAITAKMDAMRQEKMHDYSNPMMNSKARAETVEHVLDQNKGFQKLLAQQERIDRQIQAARDRLAVAVEAAAKKQADAEAREAQKVADAAERTKKRQETAARRAADEAHRAQEKAAEESRRAHERAAKRVQSVWAKAMGAVKRIQSGAATLVKKSWSKATSGISKAFHTVGRTMRRVFVLGAFLAFFHGLRDAMAGAIRQNAQLSQSLAQIKGNLYTAFASVFSAVLPAIQAMMNGLAALTNKLASFLSALFGKTLSAGKAAGKKLAAVGSGAKTATKKMEGALASWDELNVLQKKEDNAADSGGGVSGIGADFGNQLDRAASDFGQQLRDLINAGDWDGIGSLLGEKFNHLVDRIDAKALGTKFGKGLQAAIQIAHSFVQTVDWNGLGAKLAQFCNSALNQIDAYQLGSVLMSKWTIAFGTFNGFIQELDWAQLGQKLSAGVRGAFDTMAEAVESFNWAGAAQKLLELLCNIDWAGIFESVAEFAGSCIGGALSFFWTLVQAAWNGTKDFFRAQIEEAGGNVFEGFLLGIARIGDNIGNWIYDHIFEPFWKGIKAAFGIASPSKKMAEIGEYIILGLQKGITATWETITAFFDRALSNVQEIFANAWDALRENTVAVWQGIKDAIKDAINGIISAVNGMIQAVCNGINAVVDALNGISFDVPDWVPLLGGKHFGIDLPHLQAPQIPMLANGGVIKQPTLAMMGEYQDASSNPEIVAPQNIMRETFAESIAPLVEAIRDLVEMLKDDDGREIVIRFAASGGLEQLVRLLKPYIDRESNRVGAKLITGGVY